VQVDEFGTPKAIEVNALLEFQRNKERYAFLALGTDWLSQSRTIVRRTPAIVHQVNLEYLARVCLCPRRGREAHCLSRQLVGTDSHTTQ